MQGIDLTGREELPLYEYLYRCIRDQVVAGQIAAGERLPSRRTLAERLGVSVVTVEGAYAQLVAEGVCGRPVTSRLLCSKPALAAQCGCGDARGCCLCARRKGGVGR